MLLSGHAFRVFAFRSQDDPRRERQAIVGARHLPRAAQGNAAVNRFAIE
jgi:hypothetical protein